MKKLYKFFPKLGIFLNSVLLLFILVFQINVQSINALSMNGSQNKEVIEELRLKIPKEYKEVWLDAEKKIWEPWLSSQEGFLGRQLFWNKDKEEALILVNWKSKKLWKNIPMKEVNLIQEKFEDNVKALLNINKNPFELIYEGELDNQR